MGFDHYSHRFRVVSGEVSNGGLTPAYMPGLTPGLPNNHWYSWSVGPVHFVSMSTEAYFFYNGSSTQFAWLEADMAAVNRTETPWLVVFGHRSIYCSCDTDCDGDATAVRVGTYGLEALFRKYSVDLWVGAPLSPTARACAGRARP